LTDLISTDKGAGDIQNADVRAPVVGIAFPLGPGFFA